MNKLKQLRRKLVHDVGMALGVVVAFIGLLMLTGMLASSAQQKKTAASTQLTQDQTQLANLNNQFNKSGEAEKRFVDIALSHASKNYAADSDDFKNMLRKAKDNFRFSTNFKLTLAADKVADKPEFSGLNYDVTVREPMRLELEAMSDMHVYSFIDHLTQAAPGFIRITRMDINRVGEMNAETLSKMNSGDAPSLVNANIEFTWVGITPKQPNASAAVNKQPAGGPP